MLETAHVRAKRRGPVPAKNALNSKQSFRHHPMKEEVSTKKTFLDVQFAGLLFSWVAVKVCMYSNLI